MCCNHDGGINWIIISLTSRNTIFYRRKWNRKCFFSQHKALPLFYLLCDCLRLINDPPCTFNHHKCFCARKKHINPCYALAREVIFNYFMSKHNLLWLWRFGWLWNCFFESENNLCKLAEMLILFMFYKRKHRSLEMHTTR